MNLRFLYLLLFLAFVPCLNAQWRWDKNDKWNSTNGMVFKYDKVEHAVGSGFLYDGLLLITKDKTKAFVWTITLGTFWEMKDAVVPYEKYGRIGGEGFSWKDLGADIVGLFLV